MKSKFIKLLTLIGMMLVSVVLGTESYANMQPIGIFNKLVVDTENIVPFILADRDAFISTKYIKESMLFKDKTIEFDKEVQEGTRLCTGDTFKVEEKTYTILIYGDVNEDGYVDVFDALTIQENTFENKLNEIQKVAANVLVANASDMDVFDALAIQQYSGGLTNTINNSENVWVGETGTKYHIQSCRTLRGKGHQITMFQALAEERQPCKVCYK